MGRHVEQQMDVVRPDMALQNLHVIRAADLADQIAHLDRDVAAENQFAILRAEHKIVVQVSLWPSP